MYSTVAHQKTFHVCHMAGLQSNQLYTLHRK
jgi:hypothetical protein